MTEEPLFDYAGDEQLELAAGVVREYCGWHIAPVIEEDLVLDGSDSAVQMLPSLHVLELTNCTNAGAEVSPLWSEKGWMRTRGGLWTADERGVHVHLRHGLADCPATIKAVVKRLARQGDGMIGSGSVRLGQRSVSISQAEAAGIIGADEYSKAILDRYAL